MTTHPLPLPIPVRLPEFSQILIPIDFSDASIAAVDRAIHFANLYNSSIVLVYAAAHVTNGRAGHLQSGIVPEAELNRQDDLDNLRKMALQSGVPCTMVVQAGNTLGHIQDSLLHHSIDLLVLPAHGDRGNGMFFGTSVEHLIRAISIPVLTVGDARNQPGWGETGIRHILFAGDFAPETLVALSLTLGIQQTADIRLSVVDIVPRDTRPEAVRAIREEIQSLVPSGTDIYTPAGPIGKTVCQVARDLGVGLLVLGTHRSTFAREIFETDLQKILVNAPCPVLSIREPDN